MKALVKVTPDLSEIVGEKLYTLEEALDILGWSYSRSDDEEERVYDIKCCGEPVAMVGIVGVDYAFCGICERGVCDMTGIVPLKPHLRGMIEPDRYRHPVWLKWLPVLKEANERKP